MQEALESLAAGRVGPHPAFAYLAERSGGMHMPRVSWP